MGGFFALFEDYDVVAAFWVNIQLAFWAGIASLVLGTILAVMRISPIASLRWFGTAYVNIFRNTPLTIIMVFSVLGLWGQLQVNFSTDFNLNFFLLAVLSLSIYHAAFVCEAIRSGVNTVPLGQAEAARSIGLSFLPAAWLIILPQAFRGAVAPLGNVLIALVKNTTVAAAASVAEASGLMKTMIEFRPDVMTQIFLTFAIGFVIIVIPIGLLTTWASKKLAVAR
ncbi:ABC transporter permease subunit [Arthrobacter sp. zg-Y820]|uniref:amino acid ABC transporter permease n=1 Tax=unclassified Arthrobacter TaxID=235627 RepID=UPI001E60AB84|nr:MULTISPECIES: ABC transporter permease subunit [unclassified Arthrobacter]MCC9195905.1 ABC transporter permease subunit [Arthrobacter sp. zg-Y820]MDK1278765.1 ABC transporter permease subunit [Arthrobacter sp. zg.Y820]MDK1359619.1 ABC transporter permease subunit [Arthrobacter sp. zg-Y1219]WIB08812.1 ABC transporter permease subunit [Arthrobacter sp. zg-Y820]